MTFQSKLAAFQSGRAGVTYRCATPGILALWFQGFAVLCREVRHGA